MMKGDDARADGVGSPPAAMEPGMNRTLPAAGPDVVVVATDSSRDS
jgi:hypothetical protein